MAAFYIAAGYEKEFVIFFVTFFIYNLIDCVRCTHQSGEIEEQLNDR